MHQEDINSDEEEFLVYVDFSDFRDCNILSKATHISFQDLDKTTSSCKIISSNTEYIFAGEHGNMVGTSHIFDTDNDEVRHVGSTTRVTKMTMQRFAEVPSHNDSKENDMVNEST